MNPLPPDPPAAGRLPVVGIVGGIGAGKSLVADALARRGGHLIPADQLGHEALRQEDVKRVVVERFGPAVLDEGGAVSRRRLGARVFGDEAERRALEAIVFPYIGRRVGEEIARAAGVAGARFVVLDAAVMLEAGWAGACDRILFVDAPRDVRLARLRATRGWTEEELRRREAAQLPLEEKRRRADAVIDNAGTPAALEAQVDAQVAALLRPRGDAG
jgi:dephospho-CoA kinase